MLGGIDGIIGRDLFESYMIRVERGRSLASAPYQRGVVG